MPLVNIFNFLTIRLTLYLKFPPKAPCISSLVLVNMEKQQKTKTAPEILTFQTFLHEKCLVLRWTEYTAILAFSTTRSENRSWGFCLLCFNILSGNSISYSSLSERRKKLQSKTCNSTKIVFWVEAKNTGDVFINPKRTINYANSNLIVSKFTFQLQLSDPRVLS